MIKNKIEGVKPFNEFWFKSCYYHQLISGLSCLGVDKSEVLANYIVFAKSGFQTDSSGILTEKQFEKVFGFKNKSCNINEKSLRKRIDKGQPVIVGVDNYYLKERTDCYYFTHALHFILVYGYDTEKREVNIVDHAYQNSFVFEEKTMSLDELLLANKMYRKSMCTKKTTCHVLIGKKQNGIKNKNIFTFLSKERLVESKKNAEENLEMFKKTVESGENILIENLENGIKYFQEMKQSHMCLSKLDFFKYSEDQLVEINKVLSGYSMFLSMFFRMMRFNDLGFATKNKEGVIKKIEETMVSEKKVYNFLEEICQ